MKRLISILFLLFVISGSAQEKSEPRLIDEFGKPSSEYLLARFDDLIVQQKNNPGMSAYIYFYGDDELEGRNLSFANYLKQGYHRLKTYPERQFNFVQGGTLDKMKIQFWLIPPALALDTTDALLIIDEKKGRRVAEQLGIEIIGTVGVLIKARIGGFIEHPETLLPRLESVDFRLNDVLRSMLTGSCDTLH